MGHGFLGARIKNKKNVNINAMFVNTFVQLLGTSPQNELTKVRFSVTKSWNTTVLSGAFGFRPG